MSTLNTYDPFIALIIAQEDSRQKEGITLIASENRAHPAVLEALSSSLINKYAEGYPGKRYYAGCEYADAAELLALERCKALFKGEHANVQPHAGSSANAAVYAALLNPGDTIMGMSMASGGHLTHGSAVSFSGKFFNAISYDVDPETEVLNYNTIAELAEKHRPKLIIAGASSYSRIIDAQKFAEIAQSVDAYLLVDCAHTAGLIAAGLYPNPVLYADVLTATTHKTLRGPRGGFILCKNEFKERIDRAVFPGLQGGPFMHSIAAKAVTFKLASEEEFVAYQKQALSNAQTMVTTFKDLGYRIVSDGTDTHLFIIDLSNKKFNGRQAELLLEQEHIYVSRSLIPFDKEKPWITSGIRIGTLATTAQEYKEQQAESTAVLIDTILKKSLS